MEIKLRIKEIIIEIEYVLVITLLVTSVSKSARSFLCSYYICLLFVIFHELAHVFVGSVLGKKLRKIFLGISGMTAFFKYDYLKKTRKSYTRDLLVYLAGPVSNIVIAAIFYQNTFIYEINIFLAILNFLPIFPLDGYNIIKSIFMLFYINNKNKVVRIVNVVSLVCICFLSVLCLTVFWVYKNISSIIFLLYILILNIKSDDKIGIKRK